MQGAELTIERASSGGFYKPPFWDSRIDEESQKVYRTGRHTCKKSRARKLAVCIARLDLVPVHYLLAIRYGWDRRKIQRTDRKYRMYWQDMREGRMRSKLLSADVDEMWHCHILMTERYIADCDRVFGEYLHHAPVFPDIPLASGARRRGARHTESQAAVAEMHGVPARPGQHAS